MAVIVHHYIWAKTQSPYHTINQFLTIVKMQNIGPQAVNETNQIAKRERVQTQYLVEDTVFNTILAKAMNLDTIMLKNSLCFGVSWTASDEVAVTITMASEGRDYLLN